MTALEKTPVWDGLPIGRRVLVAEDDSEMRDLVELVLHEGGYQVATASTGAELRRLLSEPHPMGRFDLIVTDVVMADSSGLDVIDQLRQNGDSTPVLVMTAFPRDDVQRRARGLEVRLLAKPFDLDTLRLAVDREIRANAPHQGRTHRWQ
jgi:DNA-binding response OmpR family regulator